MISHPGKVPFLISQNKIKKNFNKQIDVIFAKKYLILKILKLETIIILMENIEEQHTRIVTYNLIYTTLKYQLLHIILKTMIYILLLKNYLIMNKIWI